MIPTNNPSGVRKRQTVWPQGSVLFFYEHSMPLRFQLLSCLFDVIHVKLEPGLWCREFVRLGILTKAGLCGLRERPQSKSLGAFESLGVVPRQVDRTTPDSPKRRIRG